MASSDDVSRTGDGTLGRIALKKVPVGRAGGDDASMGAGASTAAGANPMNQLVPYLDLFSRLDDEELSRLAHVPSPVVLQLRRQIDEINRALAPYVDLLPRLRDDELARLTGAPEKTIRFWRHCQPRNALGRAPEPGHEPGAVTRPFGGGESDLHVIAPERRAAPGPTRSPAPGEAPAGPQAAAAPVPFEDAVRPSRTQAANARQAGLPADDEDELTITHDDFF